MKKLSLLILIGILYANLAHAEKFEIDIPDKYIDLAATSFGWTPRVSTITAEKRIAKVDNPKTKQEFILEALQSAVDANIKNKLLTDKVVIAKQEVESEYAADTKPSNQNSEIGGLNEN